jgi:large subunit ribosomal protein L35
MILHHPNWKSRNRKGVVTVPKIKTHKSTSKRFKVTGKGKVRRLKQGRSHLRRKKSKRSKRELQQDVKIDSVNLKRLERLLGRRFKRD